MLRNRLIDIDLDIQFPYYLRSRLLMTSQPPTACSIMPGQPSFQSFYGAALIATSLLPILLYKKTRHEWLAISVPVVIDLFLISLPFWSRIG
jgi:hypothetical protein